MNIKKIKFNNISAQRVYDNYLKSIETAIKPLAQKDRQDILMEMLHLLIRYKCLEENISHSLVMSRTILKKMKADKDHFDDCLENGWRRIFFGEEISKWLKNRNNLILDFGSGKFELKLEK